LGLRHLSTSSIDLQGGVIEVGAPTGKWQLIVVYRGKHCPVSRNYLASLQQIIYELDDLGVEVLALTADGREKAEAFVSSPPASFKFQFQSSCSTL
jgi:peroxiredoxin